MTAGRPRKPTNLHVINGTDRPCRRNDDEPQPDIIDDIPYPAFKLSDSAMDQWTPICRELMNMRVLTRADIWALTLCCQALGQFIDAQDEIYGDEESGKIGAGFTITTDKGNELQHPAVAVSNRAFELAAKMLTEFGMTPSSRTKIKVSPGQKKQNRFSGNGVKQGN